LLTSKVLKTFLNRGKGQGDSNAAPIARHEEDALFLGPPGSGNFFVSKRLAANYAWMANTSAHTRLRWNSGTGHNPGAGVSRCWRLVDKTFCRAKTCLHV